MKKRGESEQRVSNMEGCLLINSDSKRNRVGKPPKRSSAFVHYTWSVARSTPCSLPLVLSKNGLGIRQKLDHSLCPVYDNLLLFVFFFVLNTTQGITLF